MAHRESAQYSLLATTDKHEDSLDRDEVELPVKRSSPRTTSRVLLVAVFICIISTLVNVFLLTLDWSDKELTQESLGQLKRPNQFIGLDSVKRPSPPISRRVANYPQLQAQVNSSNPRQIFPDDPRGYFSPRGYISPEDRQMLVTPEISTVVQFRTIDFGMEDCELNVIVPRTRYTRPSEVPEYDPGLKLGPRNAVDIWWLDSEALLNPKKLSKATMPKRKGLLATISVRLGSEYSQHFPCPRDTVVSLEFTNTPGSESTHVEWWQDREGPLPAVFLYQHSTI